MIRVPERDGRSSVDADTIRLLIEEHNAVCCFLIMAFARDGTDDEAAALWNEMDDQTRRLLEMKPAGTGAAEEGGGPV